MTRRKKIRYELVRGFCFLHPPSHKSFSASVNTAAGVITSGSMRTRENLSLSQAAAAAAAATTTAAASAVSSLHLLSRGKCNKRNRGSRCKECAS